MDDFYAEMRMRLNDIETSNSQRSTILEEYFPNMFAEALVPINPTRWPAFLAGSASASDMRSIFDLISSHLNRYISLLNSEFYSLFNPFTCSHSTSPKCTIFLTIISN
jgi:hypothetical protein